MQMTGISDRAFEARWRGSLAEMTRRLGLEALAFHRSDLAPDAAPDQRRLRLAIWVRGRQVGELVAVSRSPLTHEASPAQVQALFALREAIEADLGQSAAVA